MRTRSECLVYPFSAALHRRIRLPFLCLFSAALSAPLRQAGGGAGGTLLARRKEGPPVPRTGGRGPMGSAARAGIPIVERALSHASCW
jgi:hypothetical protein